MSKPRSVNDGDWICADADCSNINFSWRVKCNKCGRDKGKVEIFKKTGTEIGKKAAEKSGGLFSADDWHCSSCGNVNWARRTDCNICHAPKYGTIEPRTGLGGGYNERENVEYIERDESEDEYDDFGRRKKKYRHKSNDKNGGNKTRGTKEKPKAVVELSNEKEDSGEELDLSKYDVVGDARDERGEEEEDEDDDDDDSDDVDLSKYDFGDDSPVEKPPEENRKVKEKPKLRSRSRSPLQKNNHSKSPSPRRHSRSSRCSRSRSRSRDRRKHRSRSRERSRSPVRKQRLYRSRSRSRSRDRDKGSSYGRSRRSRSRSRERRSSRRSRSRSRSRDRDKRRSARSRSRDRYR